MITNVQKYHSLEPEKSFLKTVLERGLAAISDFQRPRQMRPSTSF